MKRLIALIMMAALMLSLLAACSSGTNVDKKVEIGTGYDGSEVTITFSHTMGANLREVLDYHIGEFNKLYPNIHIEHTSVGGWQDIAGIINTEIMGDNQPNVAYCYPDHLSSASEGRSSSGHRIA